MIGRGLHTFLLAAKQHSSTTPHPPVSSWSTGSFDRLPSHLSSLAVRDTQYAQSFTTRRGGHWSSHRNGRNQEASQFREECASSQSTKCVCNRPIRLNNATLQIISPSNQLTPITTTSLLCGGAPDSKAQHSTASKTSTDRIFGRHSRSRCLVRVQCTPVSYTHLTLPTKRIV